MTLRNDDGQLDTGAYLHGDVKRQGRGLVSDRIGLAAFKAGLHRATHAVMALGRSDQRSGGPPLA